LLILKDLRTWTV